MSRLTGVRAKIERAKKHVRDLDVAIRAFTDRNPGRECVVSQPQSDTAYTLHCVRLLTPIGSDIPVIAGDAVHNLRSALDHLAWQLVEANGQTPGRHTYFPLCDQAQKYRAPETERKIEGISAPAKQVIEAAQPYQAGYDLLGTLHEMNNWDKHRLLLVAACRLVNTKVEIRPTDPGPVPTWQIAGPGPLQIFEDGDPIFLVHSPGNMQADQQLDITFTVAFREPQVVHGKPILETLAQLTDLVEGVTNLFVPFL